MKAKVTLTRGPSTHSFRGTKFVRGVSQELTNRGLINYYQTAHGFTVQILEDDKQEDVKKKSENIIEEEVPRVYTEEQLNTKKKPKLVKVAKLLDCPLTGGEKKPEVIEAILLAQDLNRE